MVIEKAFIAFGEFYGVVAVVLNHWCFEVARKQPGKQSNSFVARKQPENIWW
jgi:hypothetical protein